MVGRTWICRDGNKMKRHIEMTYRMQEGQMRAADNLLNVVVYMIGRRGIKKDREKIKT